MLLYDDDDMDAARLEGTRCTRFVRTLICIYSAFTRHRRRRFTPIAFSPSPVKHSVVSSNNAVRALLYLLLLQASATTTCGAVTALEWGRAAAAAATDGGMPLRESIEVSLAIRTSAGRQTGRSVVGY